MTATALSTPPRETARCRMILSEERALITSNGLHAVKPRKYVDTGLSILLSEAIRFADQNRKAF